MADYILKTNESMTAGSVTVYRVIYKDTGQVGGWIEDESNLSKKGNCRVLDDAIVYGNAIVTGDAIISGSARVFGHATVSENAQVMSTAKVFNNAQVSGNAEIKGNAKICGKAQVSENAYIHGNAEITGESQISGRANISGKVKVTGKCIVKGHQILTGDQEYSKGIFDGDTDFSNITGAVFYDLAYICQVLDESGLFYFDMNTLDSDYQEYFENTISDLNDDARLELCAKGLNSIFTLTKIMGRDTCKIQSHIDQICKNTDFDNDVVILDSPKKIKDYFKSIIAETRYNPNINKFIQVFDNAMDLI